MNPAPRSHEGDHVLWYIVAGVGGVALLLAVIVAREIRSWERTAESQNRISATPPELTADLKEPMSHDQGDGAPSSKPKTPVVVVHDSDDRIAEPDPPPDPDRPISGTQRSYYERFLAEGRNSPEIFAKEAERILGREGPLPEKVAFLIASYNIQGSDALPYFTHVIRSSGGATELDVETLRKFAVDFLCRKASTNPAIFPLLGGEVFSSDWHGPSDLRHTIVRVLFQSGAGSVVRNVAPALYSEQDPAIVATAIRGMKLNGSEEAAAVLAEIALKHPNPEIRDLVGREQEEETQEQE